MEEFREDQFSAETRTNVVAPEMSNKKENKIKKFLLTAKDFLFKDWKKDLKKMQSLLVVIFYVVVVLGIISFFTNSLFGWRIDVFANKIAYKTYSHIAPNFSFKYPTYFQIDNGEGKNYGDSYLAGLKLNTDSRTGCDIRSNDVGLNFEKSDEEIKKALVTEVYKTAKDFSLVKAKRMKIDGENAFSLEFTFTDPIGSKSHLNQIITGREGRFYMIICGTGDYQYKYFQKDFQSFLKSFTWNQKVK